MKHTESELLELKNSIEQMWIFVRSQLDKSRQALMENNRDLASVVISNEKRVNAYELKIDSDCENYIALFSPVAIDLRFVLSILKINKTLERIGDFADGIARFVIAFENDTHDHAALLAHLEIDDMMKHVDNMLDNTLKALQEENTAQARKIFSTDTRIDTLYADSIDKLADYLKDNINEAVYVLNLLAVLRKVERCGDHCNNIMEEIIFYLDAKVVKHQKK